MKPYWWSNPSFTQQYRWECWTLLRAAEGSTLKFPCFHLCSLLSIHCQYDWIGFGIQLNCCTSLPISHFLVLPFWIVANVHPYLRIWLTFMFFPQRVEISNQLQQGAPQLCLLVDFPGSELVYSPIYCIGLSTITLRGANLYTPTI